jgi:hypothetical protein
MGVTERTGLAAEPVPVSLIHNDLEAAISSRSFSSGVDVTGARDDDTPGGQRTDERLDKVEPRIGREPTMTMRVGVTRMLGRIFSHRN